MKILKAKNFYLHKNINNYHLNNKQTLNAKNNCFAGEHFANFAILEGDRSRHAS
jgi:hypothetical protein